MPKELRRIVFDHEELHECVLALRRTSPGVLEEGEITCISTEPCRHIAIEMVNGNTEKKTKIEADQLLPAIIQYCKEINIPISRIARKRVLLTEEGIALDLKINEDDFVIQAVWRAKTA